MCRLSLAIAVVILLVGCAQKPISLETGQYKVYSTITIQDDWCYMPDGTRANGLTNYTNLVNSVTTICISLKSDDVERTLHHELSHAGRNAVGLTVATLELP